VHNLSFYLHLVRQAREHIIAGDFSSWKSEQVQILKERL
jgi:queuine tRNA-ribosyltransferase